MLLCLWNLTSGGGIGASFNVFCQIWQLKCLMTYLWKALQLPWHIILTIVSKRYLEILAHEKRFATTDMKHVNYHIRQNTLNNTFILNGACTLLDVVEVHKKQNSSFRSWTKRLKKTKQLYSTLNFLFPKMDLYQFQNERFIYKIDIWTS